MVRQCLVRGGGVRGGMERGWHCWWQGGRGGLLCWTGVWASCWVVWVLCVPASWFLRSLAGGRWLPWHLVGLRSVGSVRTEIEELPPLPEFSTAPCNSEFLAQLEELIEPMNPSSYWPTEPHLWLVGKIPNRTSENCRETSERKSRTHSYDDLGDLLIEVAWRGRMAPIWINICATICEGRDPC